ncbi:MAG TPA: MBL fold metallo-hydrolase [Thermoanaerobaculia bacterium]|nr:MBL fold metallo-hydrolase [Thermoanaerobaculia bacterium]
MAPSATDPTEALPPGRTVPHDPSYPLDPIPISIPPANRATRAAMPVLGGAPVQTVLDFWITPSSPVPLSPHFSPGDTAAPPPASAPDALWMPAEGGLRAGARPPMRISVLGSGSGGNAFVVESGGSRLLVDAGFSSREIGRRLARIDVEPASLAALVLTHEHADHCRGAARFTRRNPLLPVLATAGTLAGARLGEEAARRATVLRSGEPCEVAGFRIEPFLLPHDAREPIGAVIETAGGCRLGLIADCGTYSHLAWARLHDVDILVLETNHDLDMLRNGPYPWPLKQRIASRHGHLSNREAADRLPELAGGRLRWVVLYHLSRTNNLPALAAAAIGESLARAGCPAAVALTDQDHPTPWLEVT